MRLSYPVSLKKYPNEQVGVTFVDVPEAMTAGSGVEEALRQTALTALGLRVAIEVEPVHFISQFAH